MNSELEIFNKAKKLMNESCRLPKGTHMVAMNGEIIECVLKAQPKLDILRDRLAFYGMKLVGSSVANHGEGNSYAHA